MKTKVVQHVQGSTLPIPHNSMPVTDTFGSQLLSRTFDFFKTLFIGRILALDLEDDNGHLYSSYETKGCETSELKFQEGFQPLATKNLILVHILA